MMVHSNLIRRVTANRSDRRQLLLGKQYLCQSWLPVLMKSFLTRIYLDPGAFMPSA